MLGIRPRGRRMEGADKSTRLWTKRNQFTLTSKMWSRSLRPSTTVNLGKQVFGHWLWLRWQSGHFRHQWTWVWIHPSTSVFTKNIYLLLPFEETQKERKREVFGFDLVAFVGLSKEQNVPKPSPSFLSLLQQNNMFRFRFQIAVCLCGLCAASI